MKYQHIQYTLITSLVFWFFTMRCLASDSISADTHLKPGHYTLYLSVDGLKRTYTVHVPSGYDSKTPLPLVIMLHGGGGTARAAIWETGWTQKADEAGFLAAFPNAASRDPSQRSSLARNPQLWNDGSNRFYQDQKTVNDIHFISALLDDVSARFIVDRRQIFVTGFSNGASMSFLVGAQLSNRIAAIAPVAGACWIDPVNLKRPVPMLYITGRDDPMNRIEGGVPKLATGALDKVRAKPKPPVRASILKWVKAIGCSTTPLDVTDVNGVHTETYGSCRNGAEMVFIIINGLGHTWAGGKSLLPERLVGATSNKINATDIIWDFFLKHARSIEAEQADCQTY